MAHTSPSPNPPHPLASPRLTQALQLLQTFSPALAGRAASLLFLSPARHPTPPHEQDALITASRHTLRWRGHRVPIYSWGRGPVILFAHGWEGRGTQVAPLLGPLRAAGYRVVAYDVPSHGAARRGLVSIVDFAQVARAVAAHLGSEVHAAIGHSLGAAALTLAAAEAPFAERIALIAPPLSPRPFLEHFAGKHDLSPATKRALLDRLETRYGVRLEALDLRERAERAEAKALILHDRTDAEVPFHHGEKLAAAWAGARFVATQGLGHRRILRDPEVIAQVGAFIGRPRRAAALEHTIANELFEREQRLHASV